MKTSDFNSFSRERGSIQQILVLFIIALIIVATVMAIFGYKIGHKQGARSVSQAAIEAKEASLEAESSAEMATLKSELATAIQERDIGLSNIETLKEENETLKTQNLQVAQFNALLLDSVAKEGGVPLNVLASEIVPLPDRTYEYRFDVAMIDKSGKPVKMTPKLILLNATNMVEIPLKPSTYDVQGIARIRGRFVMPEEFEPKQIKIELTAGTEHTEQLYDWQVGKVIGVNEGEDMSTLSDRPISDQEVQNKTETTTPNKDTKETK